MFTLDPNNADFLNTLEFFLHFIGGALALFLFFVGLRRYSREQVWKRNEFIAKEIKEFTSDKIVQNTMLMIDWGARYIELFPNQPDYHDRFAKVDRQIITLALVSYAVRKEKLKRDKYTPTEVAIRDHIDQFLFYFERFDQFIEAGLITKRELAPYLNYWIALIADEVEQDVRDSIYSYIVEFKFYGTQKLFTRFGKEIVPKELDISHFIDE